MKTTIFKKILYSLLLCIVIQNVSFAEDLPLRVHVEEAPGEVFVGDKIPITIIITIDPGHYIYKDQVKLVSSEPYLYDVFFTKLPEGKTKKNPFLEK